MADQEPVSLASTFPNPPHFWKDFTPENLARIEELRKAHKSAHPDDEVPTRLPEVPESLINVQPPAEPEDGRWRVFGDHYMLNDELPTLEDQGITNLPPTHPSRASATAAPQEPSDRREADHHDHAFELKRMVKSLLLNFLELTGTLSVNPNDAAAKIEDIRTLLINIHHALNEYRPHQARESAAELMQEHLDRTRRETLAIRSQVEKARRVLEGLGSLTIPDTQPLASSTAAAAADGLAGEMEKIDLEAMDRQRDRELWAATDAAFA